MPAGHRAGPRHVTGQGPLPRAHKRPNFVSVRRPVFRYPRGDRAARAQAEEYGRSVGVPEAQLDWPG